MSFLTDLFKGNTGALGKDLSHDPWGTAAGAIPLAAAAFFAPEIAAALGPALGIGTGAAEAGAAGAAGAGAAGAAEVAIPGAEALAFAPEAAAAGTFAGGAGNIAGGATALGGDVLSGVGAAAPAGGGGFGSSLLSWAQNNPGFLANLGIGLGGSLLAPKLSGLINKVPQEAQLKQLAGQEQQLGQQQQQLGTTLTQPLVTGQLPQGAEQTVENAVNDAISTTKARYASLNLSGSTMEADAISNIQNQATQSRFAIAEQMAQTGLQATNQAANAMGLQDQIYGQLMNAQVAQDTALQQAIARMAAGAALGSGTNQAQKTAAGFANATSST